MRALMNKRWQRAFILQNKLILKTGVNPDPVHPLHLCSRHLTLFQVPVQGRDGVESEEQGDV